MKTGGKRKASEMESTSVSTADSDAEMTDRMTKVSLDKGKVKKQPAKRRRVIKDDSDDEFFDMDDESSEFVPDSVKAVKSRAGLGTPSLIRSRVQTRTPLTKVLKMLLCF